jgi:hypothetical protein
MLLLNTSQPGSYLKSNWRTLRVLRAEVLGDRGKQLLGTVLVPAFVLWQLAGASRTDRGLLVLLGILLLMLIGGILLIARSITDFVRDRKAARREDATNKRKAA